MPALVKLVSPDQKEFAVDPKVAKMSKTVAALMEVMGMEDEETFDKNPIPLPNVTSDVLERVIEWCEKHKEDTPVEEKEEDNKEKITTDIPEWDKTFLKMDKENQKSIFDLMLAANYMDIRGLMDNVSKTIANVIKGNNPQEIRDFFNIVKDFTDEEEETIRKENSWGDE